MYGVAKRGNPGDFFGECGRAFGLRSATGSLGLTSGDGSLELSPVRPGCYLSIMCRVPRAAQVARNVMFCYVIYLSIQERLPEEVSLLLMVQLHSESAPEAVRSTSFAA